MSTRCLSDAVAAILTPAGRGAVATIALDGPAAGIIVAAHFRPNGADTSLPIGQVCFGHWPLACGTSEEVVICRVDENRVEIHSHGGPLVAAAILRTLEQAGAATLDWQAFVERDAPDPIAAEALLALAQAPTARTASILLDQYHGALAREITRIRKLLDSDPAVAQAALQTLLARAEFGRHLTEPWRVVIAGPPNVGKSTLLNALAGYERTIVYDAPGTTRDVVSVRIALDGWPIDLSDTAGLRESTAPLEAAGVARTQEELLAADLILWLIDATTTHPAPPPQVAAPLMVVRNKCDLRPAATRTMGGIDVSAVTGAGIDRLGKRLVERLVPSAPAPQTAVPFTQRQTTGLQHAMDCLSRAEIAGAKSTLAAFWSAAD